MNINTVTNQNFGANIKGLSKELRKHADFSSFKAVIDKKLPGDTLVFLQPPAKDPITLKRVAKVIVDTGKVHMSNEFVIPETDNKLFDLYLNAMNDMFWRKMLSGLLK
ncbi:MAG: hypothetical protein MJ180_05580 [Candidatus Gastranaerophilales bacterium]|nr:hypothetical protein [Candidatus Gastranaerophilales bacterium]